ncbi:hypothetical protein DI041_19375, partial [Stenotrophomonas maltophilia]
MLLLLLLLFLSLRLRPEPGMGSALQQPRTQETVESLRVGPGRTVRGMDAAAELTGMYLQRVLPGP